MRLTGRSAWSDAVAVALAAVALCLAGCHRAPKPPPAPPAPKPATDKTPVLAAGLDAIYRDSRATGLVAAVVQGDQVMTRGFGRLAPNDPRVPDGRTLVRLESVSKLFAADLLSAEVAAGKVQLTDPLAAYAPPGWVAPKTNGGGMIRLMNLATHTSGMPRESGVKPTLTAPEAEAARWAWLAKGRRLSPPQTEALYSNIAFDMLGDALTNAIHAPYVQALRTLVTGPLGMVDTGPSPTPEQCARMIVSDPVRPAFPCDDQQGWAASGGLYSTADDMARWLKAQLAPGAAGDRRRISQATYFPRTAFANVSGLDHAGPASAIGLGWIELAADATHPRLLEKTGGGDGFLTYVVIDPARRIGVFVAFDNVSGRRLHPVTVDANALVGALGAP